MIWVFSLPHQMTRAANKNDCTRLEEAKLVRKMMCVHSGSATDLTKATLTVVDQPADSLPLDGIHKFFVCHGSIYPDHDGFCRVSHEFLEVSWGWWEQPLQITLDGYDLLRVGLSMTGATICTSGIPGATLGMAALICVTNSSEEAKMGCW